MHKRTGMLAALWAMSYFSSLAAAPMITTDTLVAKELQGIEIVETPRTREIQSNVPLE